MVNQTPISWDVTIVTRTNYGEIYPLSSLELQSRGLATQLAYWESWGNS